MATLTIKTNNRLRDIIRGCELTRKERLEFDYLDDEQIEMHPFVRYQGMLHDLHEFTRIEEPSQIPCNSHQQSLQGWWGVCNDSYFSGTLVRYVGDCEQVVMGHYYE